MFHLQGEHLNQMLAVDLSNTGTEYALDFRHEAVVVSRKTGNKKLVLYKLVRKS